MTNYEKYFGSPEKVRDTWNRATDCVPDCIDLCPQYKNKPVCTVDGSCTSYFLCWLTAECGDGEEK
jgi:hypothetical protein